MTISVLSAAMFSVMTYMLPTKSGFPVVQVPSPLALQLQFDNAAAASSDEEGLPATSSEGSNSEPDSNATGSARLDSEGRTLILGEWD